AQPPHRRRVARSSAPEVGAGRSSRRVVDARRRGRGPSPVVRIAPGEKQILLRRVGHSSLPNVGGAGPGREGFCLTVRARSATLKYMSRLTFAALASVLVSAPAAAQRVPARDLFEFPLGLLADAPALSTRMPASLWNPASRAADSSARAEIGLAGLTTPQNQGAQLGM